MPVSAGNQNHRPSTPGEFPVKHQLPKCLIQIGCLAIAAASSNLMMNGRCLADAYEGFDYAPALPVSGLNGGTGWNVAWSATVAERTGPVTLTHAFALPSTGLAARAIDPAIAMREFHPATGAIDANVRPWMSFLFQREQNNPMTLEMQGLFVDPVKITVLASGAVSLQYGLNPAVMSASSASGPLVTDLYLIHLTTSSIDLWVNPTAALGPPHASVAAPININYGNVNFTFGYGQTLDEIRTGRTLNSVAATESPCPGDIAPDPGGDGVVDVDDLLAIIGDWGPCLPGAGCPTDVAPAGGDGVTNVDDLLLVIGAWGTCP